MGGTDGKGGRTCSHSGCRWPAAATLFFDYAERRVWLEDLRTRPDPAAYDLCSVHASRFRPPLGWQVQDRRLVPAMGEGADAVPAEPSA